jgi:glucose-1-phosphate thymidylyltransferase
LIGLIPAAGRGVRLGLPYPKELYPVIRENKYKPISQFVVNSMTVAGIRHIVFVINETKHQLVGFFGDGHRFNCNLSYVVQEPAESDGKSTSPGLSDALDSAYHLVRGKTVCFGMADTIMQPEDVFRRGLEVAARDDDVILMLFPTERPEKFGMVRFDNDDRVLEIVDKPKQTDLQNMWGCIIWRPAFTEFLHESIHKHGISDFAVIMNNAIKEGCKFRSVHMKGGIYIDLGTYEEIAELDRRFRED